MVRVTSARPSAGRPAVPAKITSSILPPRSALAPCSPNTQAMASTTLDLPEPLGPTTQVIPGSKRSVVDEAKDLKPFSVRLFRCTTLRNHRGTSAWPTTPNGHAGRHQTQPRGRTRSTLSRPVRDRTKARPAHRARGRGRHRPVAGPGQVSAGSVSSVDN